MQETLKHHHHELADGADSIGALLRRTRQLKNLDEREAAAKINVDSSVIRALEENQFKTLGAPIFTRTFLLRYTRMLELPEEEVLEQFRDYGHDAQPPLRISRSLKPQARMTDVRWLSYPLVVVFAGYMAFMGYEYVVDRFDPQDTFADGLLGEGDGQTRMQLPEPEERETIPAPNSARSPSRTESSLSTISSAAAQQPQEESTAETTVAEEPDTDSEASIAEMGDSDDQQTPLVAALTDLGASTSSDNNPGEDIDGAADPGETSTPVSIDAPDADAAADNGLADGHHELVLSFRDDCWVEVKDAEGERLVRSILKANSTNRYTGLAPFSLILGNAEAVTQITVDGQTVDDSVYAPTRGSVARFVLEAPAG